MPEARRHRAFLVTLGNVWVHRRQRHRTVSVQVSVRVRPEAMTCWVGSLCACRFSPVLITPSAPRTGMSPLLCGFIGHGLAVLVQVGTNQLLNSCVTVCKLLEFFMPLIL